MFQPKSDYCDIYYVAGQQHEFCYRSGLTVYEEEFRDGTLFGAGWNTAGFPIKIDGRNGRINPLDYILEASAFHLEINGQCGDYNYEFLDFSTEKSNNSIHSILKLKNTVLPINLTIHTQIDGTQCITRWMDVENLSDEPLAVSRIGIFSGVLDVIDKTGGGYRHNAVGERGTETESFYSAGFFADAGWSAEGEFGWHPIMPDITTTVDARYHHSKFRHPLLFIRDNVRGKMWFCQVAWTAGVRFELEHNGHYERNNSNLSLNVEIAAHQPMLVLRPKETFTMPQVIIGAVQGDLDTAVNQMHEHTRRNYLPEADPASCLIIGAIGATCDMSVETTKERIRRFADMGAEIFMVDAGWQCPPNREREHRKFNGTNRPDPQRYPNGIKEISDYCHEHGMKFGLWTEVERIGELSPVYGEHPEWRAVTILGKRSETYLDMSNPEAAAWAENEFIRIIEECHLDVLRIDHINPGSIHFAMGDTGTGIKECLSLRHYLAVYNMYRRLKLRYPHVIFENCAGGGGRTDLGLMKYFNHTWVSDNQVLPRAAVIGSGMTLALPPEQVDRCFSNMTNHLQGALDANVRNAMLMHMSFGTLSENATAYNPIQLEFVKHSIDIYKNFIRPFLPTSNIYHHTPEGRKSMADGVSILEVAAKDGSRGAVTVITLTLTPGKTVVFQPKGIDAGRKYRVTMDNTRSSFVIDGYELKMRGLVIDIPTAMASELILYEAIE